jgi:GntR family transcriptional repressor for pyruvate dehydrogenase complex
MYMTGVTKTRIAKPQASMAAKKPVRLPRLAEMVAAGLRDKILSGELDDGALLPRQEDLLAEFGVSPPSIREALRILETEGLITVKRGNVGGAVVHLPQASKAAYMLGLVLQSRGTKLEDVKDAIRQLEPACAAACASRPDRATTILPRLRKVMDEAEAVIDDPDKYVPLARQFHAEMVAHCGNTTMSLVVGTLETLWSGHVDTLARKTSQYGSFADKKVRLATAREHEKLYKCIEEGDARGAEKAAREHLSESLHENQGWRHSFDVSAVVKASTIRDV